MEFRIPHSAVPKLFLSLKAVPTIELPYPLTFCHGPNFSTPLNAGQYSFEDFLCER
jgi:hypothetical protein